MRADFDLPEDDIIFLRTLGLDYDCINDSGMQWVIIRDYAVSEGYNVEKVDVAVKIETGYPRTPLDMAYFYPPLARKDGQIINALCIQTIEGKGYQRWSRHRTAENPWREGVDDLSAHLTLVSNWFLQEFNKRPNAITT
jgi:hypothetical protein